tara:strand:+ start:3298 stop:3534 length:237 start_codon:yes stop_codon:yes gene_type:complete
VVVIISNKERKQMTKTKNNNKDLSFKKAGWYTTYETQEELQAYFKKFTNDEQFLLQLGSNLTWNWFVHILKDYNITPK